MNDDGGDAARCLLEEFLDDPDADWAVLDGLPMPPPENRFRGGDEEVGVPLPMPLPANRLHGGDEEVDDGPLAEKRLGVDAQEGGELLDPKRLGVDDPERPGVDEQKAVLQPPAMDPLPPLPTPLPENRFRGGDKEVGGPLAVTRFGVDELEVEAFPSVGASAAEPPVSEELVQRLDPPVSGVMDSPLVLLFAFFSWKWRKKLVQLMAGLDLLPDGEMDSPTYAGSTGISVQRLSGQDELVQATSTTTSTAVAAETHILARTRRPCFGLWSCWFVLASEVLTPLEVVATSHVLAAAGH